MTPTEFDLTLLSLLYRLASTDRPASIPRICRCTGLPAAAAVEALERLASAGLADAQRVRLTLPGLAIAVAQCSGAQAQRRGVAA
jgi:hypothetical protein